MTPSVMDWKRRRSWRSVVQDALVERVGQDYPLRLAAAAGAIDGADDSDAVFVALRGRISRDNLIADVEQRWVARVSHVMAYHACRTDDVQAYFRRGLLPFRTDVETARARVLLSSKPFGLSAEDLEAAIAEVAPTLEEGRLFLAIDPRVFIEECGHYLIHGSEYLQNLLATLPEARWEELRAGLRARGRATVLRCRIPREWVSAPTELVASMIVDHCWSIAKEARSPHWLNHTVTLHHSVPPDMVVGACHPVRIKDPHAGYRTWSDGLKSYEP